MPWQRMVWSISRRLVSELCLLLKPSLKWHLRTLTHSRMLLTLLMRLQNLKSMQEPVLKVSSTHLSLHVLLVPQDSSVILCRLLQVDVKTVMSMPSAMEWITRLQSLAIGDRTPQMKHTGNALVQNHASEETVPIPMVHATLATRVFFVLTVPKDM